MFELDGAIMFPTKRLNPVAGTLILLPAMLSQGPLSFQQSDLTQSPGRSVTANVKSLLIVEFPTKRLNPVAGTKNLSWEKLNKQSGFQQSDLTQSPGQSPLLKKKNTNH